MPALFPDEIEVHVFRRSGGTTLVAAIELISPGNKDRAEARRAFAAKCASYLQQGIGLVIVDIVTERQANLHDELNSLLEHADTFQFPQAAATKKTGAQFKFLYGTRNVIAAVIEARGPLGIKGRHLYRIRLGRKAAEPDSFELPEDELQPASPPDKGQ